MLEIKGLSFGYGQQQQLFANLDLALPAGGICGLLGKNGAGKTTLLKIIAGLVFPDSGSCQVQGLVPQQRRPSFLANIFIIPEDLYLPALTLHEYLKCYASFYPRFEQQAFDRYLEIFDIPRNKILTTLSHGQKKKFLIAFGLATNCQLLIMDEPSNGLDIPSKAQFRKLLASVITEDKLIIISTHQVHDIENIIDTLVILDDGKILLNQCLNAITDKLAFVHTKTSDDVGAALYMEHGFGGYIAVIKNENEQDTQINLEVFFNAMLAKPQDINQLFGDSKND